MFWRGFGRHRWHGCRAGHLLGGWATADGFQRAIAGFAKTDPLQPYTAVMVPPVLAVPGFFGPLFVFGMLAAGIGIMVGLLTPVALAGGIWLSLNNLLMGFGAGGVHHSINVLMLAVELGFLWTGAWRPYSLDSILFADRGMGVLAARSGRPARLRSCSRARRVRCPAMAIQMPCGVSGCRGTVRYQFAARARVPEVRCRWHGLVYPPVCGRAIRVALVVGTILVAIDQSDILLSGHLTALVAAKIGLTYLVSFSVSTYSALAANRLRTN